jgi:hypothetical protein
MSAVGATPNAPAVPPTITPEMKLLAVKAAAQARLKRSVSWFYWIAGLSLVNSIVVMAGGNVHFIVGLGVTQVVDAVAKGMGGAGPAVGLAFNVVVAAACVAFGVLGSRRKTWAIWMGMALYALDGLLLLAFKDILSVAFHGYVLYRLYQSFGAIQVLEKLEPKPAPAVISSSSPMG